MKRERTLEGTHACSEGVA